MESAENEPPANPASLRALVAEQPFLHGLSQRCLDRLANSAMRIQFEPGQSIFKKGDPANRFYLILQGEVVLEAPDKNGVVHRVQRLGARDALGWSWLFPPYYWQFDAVASRPTDAIFFYGTRLRQECEKDHELGFELMKRMSRVAIARLQTTRQHWIEGD